MQVAGEVGSQGHEASGIWGRRDRGSWGGRVTGMGDPGHVGSGVWENSEMQGPGEVGSLHWGHGTPEVGCGCVRASPFPAVGCCLGCPMGRPYPSRWCRGLLGAMRPDTPLAASLVPARSRGRSLPGSASRPAPPRPGPPPLPAAAGAAARHGPAAAARCHLPGLHPRHVRDRPVSTRAAPGTARHRRRGGVCVCAQRGGHRGSSGGAVGAMGVWGGRWGCNGEGTRAGLGACNDVRWGLAQRVWGCRANSTGPIQGVQWERI